MWRGVGGAVAHGVGPGAGIPAEDAPAEVIAAVRVRERAVLPVSRHKCDIDIAGMRDDRSVNNALASWKNLRRRHPQRGPGCALVGGTKDTTQMPGSNARSRVVGYEHRVDWLRAGRAH